jgi:hypothetical protein
LGLTGLGMVAWLDIPVIHRGGLLAGLAGLDLLAAALLVSALLGFILREW